MYFFFPTNQVQTKKALRSSNHHIPHIFPRLAPVKSFPALATKYTFSRAWHRIHDFPRLAPAVIGVRCFPALSNIYIVSSACPWGHVLVSNFEYFWSQLFKGRTILYTGYVAIRQIKCVQDFPDSPIICE